MKLSDLFGTSLKQVSGSRDTAETQKEEAVSTERINKQIKALTPGRQLQGEIISKNGNEVKIKLSGDMVLTARLDQDVNVEEGKVLTFEVKNNGSTLSLSPLFANTATADNVFKALQMASLPINNTTVTMTEAMMQQGMSVDAKSLQNIFRDVSVNPGSSPVNVVQLHQLGMPVEEGNLQQMENYKALTHQLVKGMTDVLQELPMAFEEVYAAEGPAKAVQMYSNILQNLFMDTFGNEGNLQSVLAEALSEKLGETIAEGEILPQTVEGKPEQAVMKTLSQVTDASFHQTMIDASRQQTATEMAQELPETSGDVRAMQADSALLLTELLTSQEKENLGSMFSRLETALTETASDEAVLAETPLREELNNLIGKLEQGTAGANEVLKVLSGIASKENSSSHTVLADIFRSGEYHKIFEASALKQWALEPEEVMEDGKVEELYARLVKQLDSMKDALQSAGAGQSAAAKSVANLSQNIDFMNQMNHIYTYVQLPLKMSGQNANGELYVYTNKRSLAKNDGNISAFLHLDMEHLGPVDVYVAMQNEKVNTRFTVQDDDMLDFLNDHMHILNERLAKKGYSMKCEMSVREEEIEKSPIDRILQADKNATVLSQYAFDVRA
ncbi:MAG: flagellar hook-length control protein FliK [Lachnospiraceae bacterium]